MRRACLIALLFATMSAFAQNNPPVQIVKVRVDATELDRDMLMKSLNEHGKGQHLEFVLAGAGYGYRIEFETGQKPVGTVYGDINASGDSTAVYDSQGKEMFEFKREGRWTDAGATNAAAKEIIKRLQRLWKLESKDKH